MAIKARSRGTNKKLARKALKPATTAVDRRLLAKAKSEAEEATAAINGATVVPQPKAIGGLVVSMTLDQLCVLLGQNIEPERFASEALDSIADQIDTLAALTEDAPDFTQEAWRLFKNLSERAKYAGKVVSWLGSDKRAGLPEVQS